MRLIVSPKRVSDYRHGKEKLFGFFVGQAMKGMKASKPKLLNELS